jgi:hypothetical protein
MTYKEWYAKNKVRIRGAKKIAKKKYRRTAAGRAAQRRYNHKPSRILYVRKYRCLKRYGITLEDYDKMVADRDGCCDICKKKDKNLHIDHSHTTGKVRGLLCGSCNRALGLLKDDVKFLEQAIIYLKKS